ncbi:MAG: hypothetical protein Q8O13_01740 [Candidatus Omnitrophota bacterium]|nr:hypothetical protein [Candidatus Omnitrophota bacterium]
MAEQIHKKFTDEQVKDLMQRYLNGEIKREHVQTVLKIGKTRFFALVKDYRNNPDKFTVAYQRTKHTRTLNPTIEKNILKELKTTKTFIDNKDMPIWSYNYSFIKNDLKNRYRQEVSLPTIIKRAKQHGFYIARSKNLKIHDREVITNHVGELLQHDSSFHLWSPYAKQKWWLITSLDDFSRMILYAMLILRDLAWPHILALQTVFLKYGLPLSMYVDSDSIFRFVRGRDKLHYKHHQLTDDSIPQWKQVVHDCQVKVIHALSPQAKGKVERPYGWLQDHIVRICARDNIATIAKANQVLFREVFEYNYKRVHSTTGEIPYLRYQRALKQKKNVFRKFFVPPPYKTTKDIFCFRMDRTVDAYRSISVNNLQIKFNNAPIRETVNLRIYPDQNSGLSEVRFWFKDQLLDVRFIKTRLLGLSTFKV